MNRCAAPFSLSYVILLGTFGLSGCSGFDTASFAPSTPDQITIGKIQGSVFGGHAPIVGNHIFLFQAGTGGYGTAATSLLSASFETGSAYPTAEDTTTGDVTNGDYYVTGDANGDFNISGDYTCTGDLPVYLYASGGSSTPALISSYAIASNVVTFTAANNGFAVGNAVTVAGISDTTLDVTFTVASVSTNSFTVDLTHATKSATAVNATGIINNPAIVELALLGNCTSGNFSSLNFVYMNEVSTVATAYSLSGFFSNSAATLTSNDAAHLAIPASDAAALLAIQNAATNANQLYNIQGEGPVGHIANATTPIVAPATTSNGTVPQALIDALANSLSSCVDSSNSAATPNSICTNLFSYYESNSSTETEPTDIATAAINMAHNPWNTNVTKIIALGPSGVQPYSPDASSAHDLAIGINFATTTANQSAPYLTIDADGNPWYLANTSGDVIQLSPLGAVSTTTAVTTPFQAAIDTSGNVWITHGIGGAAGIVELNNSGTAVSGSPFLTSTIKDAEGIAIDGSNYIYVGNDAGVFDANDIVVTNTSTPTTVADTIPLSTSCTDAVTGLALNGSSNLWTANDEAIAGGGAIGVCLYPSRSSTSPTFSTATDLKTPFAVAVDASKNGWIADNGATTPGGLDKITATGTVTALSGGGVDDPTGVAVDGAGLIFTSNNGDIAVYGSTLSTPAFLTKSTTGEVGLTGGYTYTPAGGSSTAVTLFAATNSIAIDASGDVWVTDSASTNVTEFIGLATPVLTPLSAQIKLTETAANP